MLGMSFMDFYKNKTAFIAGGSTGIGLAIAKAMAKKGTHVVIFARTVSRLEEAAKEIRSVAGIDVKINYYGLDAADFQQVETVFKKAVAETSVPDFLINCVGMAQPDYFENITPDIFDRTVKTNLYSVWNTAYHIVPYMKQKGGGHIVNTSSVAGFFGVFGYTDYCLTKFGVIGFSNVLRQELASGNIAVTVLCPPDTDTPGFEKENRNKPPETQAIGGKAKLLKPENVANALLKGLRKKKKIIVPGVEGKLILLLTRYAPGLLDVFVKSSIYGIQRETKNRSNQKNKTTK